MLKRSTDILIVGGGPAGLTLATAIKHSKHLKHLRTTLVEASPLAKVSQFYHEPPTDYTNRVISLTPQSKSFLKSIGVKLLEERVQPFDGIYVTEGSSKAKLEIEDNGMANMVEILNVQSSLLNTLDEMRPKDFEILDSTKVESITQEGDEPLVTLSNGESYSCKLLVGADGFNSPVRKYSGIQSRGWMYNRWGVVATMKLVDEPFKINGWQRFLTTGPVAHLPLPEDNATLVWSTMPDLANLLVAAEDDVFVALVNASFVLEEADLNYYYKVLHDGTLSKEQLLADIEHRIEEVSRTLPEDSVPLRVASIVPGSRAKFPLKLSHADTYVAPRVALVGDAAHTTHPLAGQGLNMGQGDVSSLVAALEKGVLRGQDIGNMLVLEPYWADRYPINNLLLGVVDKLHKLYSTDFAPIVMARSFGINMIDMLGGVKDIMVNIVSGKR